MWCSTPHLGGQRSHGLGVGAVGKPLLPFGGARLPPVSLAPSCQKIFTEPSTLSPVQSRYGQQHMWCSTPHLGGQRSHGLGVGAVGKPLLLSGGRVCLPFLWHLPVKQIFTGLHRALCCCCAKPLRVLDCVHISGGKGRTDSGSAPLESRSSLSGGRVCLPFLWHLPVKRYSPKTSCTEHT